jgi:hypothetical protein
MLHKVPIFVYCTSDLHKFTRVITKLFLFKMRLSSRSALRDQQGRAFLRNGSWEKPTVSSLRLV